MRGEFMNNPLTVVGTALGMTAGLLLAVAFGAVLALDPEMQAAPAAAAGMIALGLLFFAVSLFSFWQNREKRFIASTDAITWKLPFRKSVSRQVSELKAVEWNPYSWSLILDFLDGTQALIGPLRNADELCSYIRAQINETGREMERAAELRRQLDTVFQKKRQLLPQVLGCLVATLICIGLAGYLMNRGTLEGIPMAFRAAFVCACGGMLILTFYHAAKLGRINRNLPGLLAELRAAVITETPLPSGKPVRVWTDGDYTFRVTALQEETKGIQAVLETLNEELYLSEVRRVCGSTPEACMEELSCGSTVIELSEQFGLETES